VRELRAIACDLFKLWGVSSSDSIEKLEDGQEVGANVVNVYKRGRGPGRFDPGGSLIPASPKGWVVDNHPSSETDFIDAGTLFIAKQMQYTAAQKKGIQR